MLLSPQSGIIYGPVHSRRLGRSLGVNVLPAGRKVCNFDCRYCQYGWTDRAFLHGMTPEDYPDATRVAEALAEALRALPEPPDFVTFSGNGEATLHPRFGEIVDGVQDVRDRLAPRARTAILSNSSRVGSPEVREALGRLDVRIMKLDAGTERCFRRYNRPIDGVTLEGVVEGLSALPDVTLQTLLAGGAAGNLDGAEMGAWLARVESIRPSAVQIYTLDRDAPDRDLLPAGRERMESIRARVAALGVSASVY